MNHTRSFGQRITILGRLFAKRLNEQILATGLTGSQWSVVSCLLRQGSLTQAAICEQLSIEAPTISKTLLAMESAGWITRFADKNDRREKKVVLTDKAREQTAVWTNMAGSVNQEALAGISGEDIAALDRVLAQLLHNLGKSVSPTNQH
ncbi:MAG: MarR family transcriptional regulator [Negativicutes bacterium]|nr:MarR family transcriptional regulator [Negativicutes bacterium]